MIIDFHTHVYPDKIASRTMEALQSHAPQVTAYTNGTVEGLRQSMRQAGIDYSVILPVATRKGQFDTVNRFARQINDTYDDLISFGGIHPDDDDIAGKLQFLRDSGFKGIKIKAVTGVNLVKRVEQSLSLRFVICRCFGNQH